MTMTLPATTRRQALTLAAGAAIAVGVPLRGAQAQTRTIELSIGSSHPLTTSWVQPAQTYFMPEVNRRLAAAGSASRIAWKEAWGGTLFKANATLASVQQGVVDIGFVWSNLEASKMPLSQVSLATPFATDDAATVGSVIHSVHETVPGMRAEWDRQGLVFLGSSTVDTYHLFTRKPITRLDDLRGTKMSAPGAIGLWVRDTGATVVAGNLTTFYTDVQTGVADGAVVTATGATATKIFEVAPFVTLIGLGAHNNGGLAMNKDSLARLPEDVRAVIIAVGKDFSAKNGEAVNARANGDMAAIRALAPTLPTPLTFIDFQGAEKAKLVATMQDIAGDYVKTNEAAGRPGRAVLAAYMDGLIKAGARPLRNWA
jgi:TRAP-type C4-dicarboxylate transport system substrate-binding protein